MVQQPYPHVLHGLFPKLGAGRVTLGISLLHGFPVLLLLSSKATVVARSLLVWVVCPEAVLADAALGALVAVRKSL